MIKHFSIIDFQDCLYFILLSIDMTRIGLISDTHNYLDEQVFKHFDKCDEIWLAGDFGTVEIADKLKAFKPIKGVYGNIDGYDVRSVYPQKQICNCEDVKVY